MVIEICIDDQGRAEPIERTCDTQVRGQIIVPSFWGANFLVVLGYLSANFSPLVTDFMNFGADSVINIHCTGIGVLQNLILSV